MKKASEARDALRLALAISHPDFKAKHTSLLQLVWYVEEHGCKSRAQREKILEKRRGDNTPLSVPAGVHKQVEDPPDTTYEKPGE